MRLDSVFHQFSLAVFIFLIVFAPAFAQAPDAEPTLALSSPVELEIGSTKRFRLQLPLAAGDFARVDVEQRGVDAFVRVFGPDGKLIGDFDSEMRIGKIETIEFPAAADGVYKLELGTRYPLLPAGKCIVTLIEKRASNARDLALEEARRLVAESLARMTSGKLAEARATAERATEIRTRELGGADPMTLTALTQLARVIDAAGRFDEAEKLNLRILADRRKALGEVHPDVAATLNYLALNANHAENFPAAIEYHQRAVAMRETIFGADHPITAVSLLNLGVVYDSVGDKLRALEVYERAARIQERSAGAESLNYAKVVNNIGKIRNDIGDPAAAVPQLERAKAILEKLYNGDSPDLMNSIVNLAESYFYLGELDKAEAITARIRAFREKTVGARHPLTAHAIFNLGNIAAARRDAAKATELYRLALSIREEFYAPESPAVNEVLAALALLAAEGGKVDEALRLQTRAADGAERKVELNLTNGSERTKFAIVADGADMINQSEAILARFAPGDPAAVELALTGVLRTKGRVLDAVSSSLAELRRRLGPADAKLLDEFNATTEAISEMTLEGRDDEQSPADFTARLKSLSVRREELEEEIARRTGSFMRTRAVTVADVRAALPEGAALVEFAVYQTYDPDRTKRRTPTRYAAYVLRRNGIAGWKELGETARVDAAVEELRRALRDPSKPDARAARALGDLVLAPIMKLVGDASHIVVSPDGALNLVPFEALADERGRRLIENFDVSYVTSGRDLLRMQSTPSQPTTGGRPLIVANPAFGGARRPAAAASAARRSVTVGGEFGELYFAPLVGTRIEARAIGALLPDALVLEGDEATEDAVMKAQAPRILHIATHGFFLGAERNAATDASMTPTRAAAVTGNPLLRSGLVLAGANRREGGENDGILTAFEASGMNLFGTKLVVLSACDTGLGEIRAGEGVYGLRRAIVLAGAESLVMSLWPVSDQVTRELMTGFYANLKKGLGRAAALRAVKLEMLRRPGRAHPFYWAGFIQSGDWREL